ncbi:WD40 repeat-like protein [Pisolithus marmoratus]|nr:WD40 repeat-like protein [Pisolithus marmoratus]
MHVPQSDQSSGFSVSTDSSSEAGPSSLLLDKLGRSNGLANGSSFAAPMANGSTKCSSVGNGVAKHSSIARVSLPGTTLYQDPYVNREEFVRLVIQSLRDVGYIESATTLEAESGYSLEAPEVSEFRQYILNAEWPRAEALLPRLVADDESLWEALFLIGKQKYLELLEARRITAALQVLREQLAPLSANSSEQLHALSSLIMCSDAQELYRRALWDGASVASRQALLADLQEFIPSATMIPQRRFTTLLTQARHYQRERCTYHNAPMNPASFSLFCDHHCDKEDFPRITTTILHVHTDEVWNVAWSHDGLRLASASKDKTAIIWRIAPDGHPRDRECVVEFILRDHPYPVGALAWSLDDSILLTSADNLIMLWDTKNGKCITTLDSHMETVSALVWLPDGSGFMSASLDRKVVAWEPSGKLMDEWPGVPIRVTDMAVTPDMRRLIVIGMDYHPTGLSSDGLPAWGVSRESPPASGVAAGSNVHSPPGNRIVIYDFKTKVTEQSIATEGELTSVKISSDSRFALVNHAPDAVHLLDLNDGHMARKFTGQRQRQHVIRSCFGGVDGNFVVSGSEGDYRNVYVWQRDTGILLEVLSGHGNGSVNCVAWNPKNERMFASCSDDCTVRIWEPLPLPSETSVSVPPSITDVTMNGKGKGRVYSPWDDGSGDGEAQS